MEHDNYSLIVYEPFIQDTITEYDSRQKLDEWEQGVLDRMESRRKLVEDMVRKSEEEEEDHRDDEDEQDQDGGDDESNDVNTVISREH